MNRIVRMFTRRADALLFTVDMHHGMGICPWGTFQLQKMPLQTEYSAEDEAACMMQFLPSYTLHLTSLVDQIRSCYI